MSPPRVLVVAREEDEPALSLPATLARGLPDASLVRVETFAGLEAALDTKRWDVVVIDCNLPGLHPSGLGPALAAAAPAPVLLVTWGVGEVAAVAALRAGARDWVLKSELPRLRAVVAQQLARAACALGSAALDRFRRVVEALAVLEEATARLKPSEGHELARQVRLIRAAVEKARPIRRRGTRTVRLGGVAR